jgi:uncharacterized protein (TIGR02421 family)
MSNTKANAIDTIYRTVTQVVAERVGKNLRVRRNLPDGGRVRIDRQLPFLCVYRQPVERKDPGTRELVTSEAAYLMVSGDPLHEAGITRLVTMVREMLTEHFGKFLVLEVWAHEAWPTGTPGLMPGFEVVAPAGSAASAMAEVLAEALREVKLEGLTAEVKITQPQQPTPSDLPTMFDTGDEHDGQWATLGIAVRPVYSDPATGVLYPRVLQRLRSQFAQAIRKAVGHFGGVGSGEGERPIVAYQSYGPTSMVRAARLVDQQLCEVSDAFDFVLQVTPTNAEHAWSEFVESGYREEPVFYYRPLPYDPHQLKRQLFAIEVERIEDTVLAQLFRQKQVELDWQISALRELNTRGFLASSRHLYSPPDAALMSLARSVLERFPEVEPMEDHEELVPAEKIADRAREHIDYYHQQMPEFKARVEMCDQIAAGLMVSRGKLLVSPTLALRESRVEPLLNHEVGTHLVTYYNGRSQPFRQLYAGLAGYEELQEGLAVLAEYLSGGLNSNRLRNLAGRVIAVAMRVEGRAFVETFDHLHQTCGFDARQSFVTTLRAYRGGGLTKDAMYLRGLDRLLAYLAEGHDIEPLYVGKIALGHVRWIQDLRSRDIVKAPRTIPRYLEEPQLRDRLEATRRLTLLELVEHSP